MKKMLFMSMAAAAMILFIPLHAYPVSLSIGASGWYAWWDYALKDLDSGKTSPGTFNNKFTINPAPIYGPVVSLTIDKKWAVSAIFLCGSHYRMGGEFFEVDEDGIWKEYFRSTGTFKYDLDTTASFSPVSFFKIFLGFKVQSFTDEGIGRSYGIPDSWSRGSFEYHFISYGPGLGIGFTAPLAKNFYLIFNASGLYMRSAVDNRDATWEAYLPDLGFGKTRTKVDLNVFGGNTSLGFSYVFEKASVALSLGFRYQFLKNYLVGIKESVQDTSMLTGDYDWSNLLPSSDLKDAYTENMDHLYGITFTVVYSINFSNKRKS